MHQKEPVSMQAFLILSKHPPNWSAGSERSAGSNFTVSYFLMLKPSSLLKLLMSARWLRNILIWPLKIQATSAVEGGSTEEKIMFIAVFSIL